MYDYISVTQAASKLEITRSAVTRALRENRLKGHKVGLSWIIKNDDLKAFRYQRLYRRVKALRKRVRKQSRANKRYSGRVKNVDIDMCAQEY